jgi:hypothetical protein
MNETDSSIIRYAIYTRQSVEKLEDFTSCEAQFHTCQDYAKASGERNLHWCGQRFDDEGYSGATLDRPARYGKYGHHKPSVRRKEHVASTDGQCSHRRRRP